MPIGIGMAIEIPMESARAARHVCLSRPSNFF